MVKRRQSPGVGEGSLRPPPWSDNIAAIGETISTFVDLDANALCLQWRNHLGGSPPAHLPRWLLLRILAYRIQAAALGGPNKETLRVLRQPKGQRLESLDARPFEAVAHNAGRGQPESGGAARPRVEREARTSDGPGERLRLEW